MNADYVENIIRNIDKQSYKCILVDGAWGIGKSYMVKKALEDMKDRTCFISLFGMDDCQKIYHEALFQFAFRTSRGGKIASGVQNFAKAAGNFCAEVSNVSNALAQAISERELFAMTSEKFKKNRIIVIDDLERRKSGLDLEELFGVIEDLKQLNYIKIILIANSKEICNEDKEVFDKYREKIIDRSFDITEHSESIKWFDFGIDGLFIEDFLSQHRVRNLPIEEREFPQLNSLIIGVDIDRELRREKITRRLKQRLDDGMVEEVRRLLAEGIQPDDLIYYGLEYKYLTLYAIGKMTYDEMFTGLETAIHQFAKRQMTWFRGMERRGFTIHWVDASLPMEEKINFVKQKLKEF